MGNGRSRSGSFDDDYDSDRDRSTRRYTYQAPQRRPEQAFMELSISGSAMRTGSLSYIHSAPYINNNRNSNNNNNLNRESDRSNSANIDFAQRVFAPAIETERYMLRRGYMACPVCNKTFSDESGLESHLEECLSQKHVRYNVDTLVDDMDSDIECAICLEPFYRGDDISRMECLCVYHKDCLDTWLKKRACCPEHPDQQPL